jgi:hypothetical protein
MALLLHRSRVTVSGGVASNTTPNPPATGHRDKGNPTIPWKGREKVSRIVDPYRKRVPR